MLSEPEWQGQVELLRQRNTYVGTTMSAHTSDNVYCILMLHCNALGSNSYLLTLYIVSLNHHIHELRLKQSSLEGLKKLYIYVSHSTVVYKEIDAYALQIFASVEYTCLSCELTLIVLHGSIQFELN